MNQHGQFMFRMMACSLSDDSHKLSISLRRNGGQGWAIVLSGLFYKDAILVSFQMF